jgi:hypothetical protein
MEKMQQEITVKKVFKNGPGDKKKDPLESKKEVAG